MSIAGIVPRPCGNFDSCPFAVSALKQRGYSILHPERIVGNPEVMAEVALGPGKRIIKGRSFGVGSDRSHHHLQQGAPS